MLYIAWHLTATTYNKHSIDRLAAIKLYNPVCCWLSHISYGIIWYCLYFTCSYGLFKSHYIVKCNCFIVRIACSYLYSFSSIKVNKIILCYLFCYLIACKRYHTICNYASILSYTYIGCTGSDIHKTYIKKPVLLRYGNIHRSYRLQCKRCNIKPCILNSLIQSVYNLFRKKCSYKFYIYFSCLVSLKITYIIIIELVSYRRIADTVKLLLACTVINLIMCMLHSE